MSNIKLEKAKKSQLDKFKDAARDLECDDDEQRFKDRLGKLVKPQMSGQPKDTGEA